MQLTEIFKIVSKFQNLECNSWVTM